MADLVLVDLSHLFWSAFHATSDKPVSEAFEITLTQASALCDRSQYAAICCDWPPYFRRELAPSYKANREAAPEMARDQLRRVVDRLAADGRVVWQSRGFEADDVIAGAVAWAASRTEIERVIVASNDKDLLQLVSPRCSVLSTRTGATLGVPEVEAKFGVAPNQMRDLLALMGDKSDNVPGVPGVGPKKAAGLLAEFGDLDCLLARVESDPAACADDRLLGLVREHRAQLELSRLLVTLRTDAPVDYAAVFADRVVQPLGRVIDAEWDEPETEDIEMTNDERQPTEDPPSGPEQTPPEPLPPVTATVQAPTQRDDAQNSTAITVAPVEWSLALEPANTRDAYRMAKALFSSRLYPQFGNEDAIFAVVLRGRSLGLDATTSLANFHMVEGRPTMHADLIRGLVMRSKLCEYFDLVESSREKATWATKRRGAKHETRITWTIQDAHAAGLVEKTADGYRGISKSGKPSNWDKYRPAMLRHRAGVELARAVYPDVTAGLYTPDEFDGEASGVIDAKFEAA